MNKKMYLAPSMSMLYLTGQDVLLASGDLDGDSPLMKDSYDWLD